jgi:rhodanese-related sulfurtransferase
VSSLNLENQKGNIASGQNNFLFFVIYKIMKTQYFLILLTLTLPVSLAGQVPDSIKYKSLPPREFLSACQKSEHYLLIDVREFFEYRKSRIKDAINIPSMGNLDIPADTIDKKNDLFFYCTSGFRSKRVAKTFFDKGFSHCYSLDGGIVAWRKEKLPVDKKRVKRTAL